MRNNNKGIDEHPHSVAQNSSMKNVTNIYQNSSNKAAQQDTPVSKKGVLTNNNTNTNNNNSNSNNNNNNNINNNISENQYNSSCTPGVPESPSCSGVENSWIATNQSGNQSMVHSTSLSVSRIS